VVSYVELPGHHCLYARREFPAGYPHVLIDLSFRALVHESVLRSDLCVVPSEHARSLLPAELRPRARVRMEGFRPAPPVADRAALRRALGLPPESPIVGFAGRSLEAVRGFDVFVRAAAEIRRRRPDARFLVIGDEQTLYGSETAYLDGESFKRRVMTAAEGGEEGFLFRPFMARDEFVRHLQAMDLALFPIFEGAGNWGPFEAMAAGLPVLASDRCFLPEVITHGRDGLLLDAEDAVAFAAAALDLLARPDRGRRLGANARRTIARRFSEEAARDGYAAILTEALERASGTERSPRAAVA
jgi:glycosyltransferase involved in cell wall biosynthesis